MSCGGREMRGVYYFVFLALVLVAGCATQVTPRAEAPRGVVLELPADQVAPLPPVVPDPRLGAPPRGPLGERLQAASPVSVLDDPLPRPFARWAEERLTADRAAPLDWTLGGTLTIEVRAGACP